MEEPQLGVLLLQDEDHATRDERAAQPRGLDFDDPVTEAGRSERQRVELVTHERERHDIGRAAHRVGGENDVAVGREQALENVQVELDILVQREPVVATALLEGGRELGAGYRKKSARLDVEAGGRIPLQNPCGRPHCRYVALLQGANQTLRRALLAELVDRHPDEEARVGHRHAAESTSGLRLTRAAGWLRRATIAADRSATKASMTLRSTLRPCRACSSACRIVVTARLSDVSA